MSSLEPPQYVPTSYVLSAIRKILYIPCFTIINVGSEGANNTWAGKHGVNDNRLFNHTRYLVT